MTHAGELLALTTAFIWAFGATLFGMVADRTSSLLVNAIRLPSGALLLWLSWAIPAGALWPEGVGWRQHLWLGLSGVTGLAIGDSFYYLGIILVGPRRASSMLVLTPVVAAVAAWFLLDERLGWLAITGIAVVIAGILVALLGRDEHDGTYGRIPRDRLWRGLAAAAVCALCSGLGNVFAKLGMADGLAPLPATMVRGIWAVAGMGVFLIGRRGAFRRAAPLREPRVWRLLLIAICLGPFLGMWFAITALKLAETGVATVLMNVVPITVLLPAWLFHRDRPSPTALIGVLLAIGGGTLLFIR